MPIVRRFGIDSDEAKRLIDLSATREWTEAEIDAMAAEDGNAWTDEDFAAAVVVYPPPSAERVRALRAKLGLSQAQFALRFGFTIDTLQQYEQGRRTPSGPASTLLRVIEMEPDAVIRAMQPRRSDWPPGLAAAEPAEAQTAAKRAAPSRS
jgi:putative transcriptional regulator